MDNKKKKILFSLLIVTIIGIILTLFINIYMILYTKNKIIDVDKVSNDFDAILVLGCKTEDGIPSLMLEKRLDKVIDVYNKLHTKIIVSGDNTRDDYDEVNVMEKYLLNHGILSEDIIKDYAGINTYDSIYRAKNTFNINNIVIITQKYHMYRALYIADKLNIEAKGIIADNIDYPFIMLKNNIREVFARDKNFFKVIFEPQSKYLEEIVN